MIPKREILTFATQTTLRASVIEKDYVLGWILGGIQQHPLLNENFVFKGGTCLKKCYFDSYRFSEDLDFTVTDSKLINEALLKAAFQEVSEWVANASGIIISAERINFTLYTNPRGQPAIEGRLYYQGPLAASSERQHPRIKIDLTADEVLVMAPAINSVKHRYSDFPTQGLKIACYSYEEIFAEKIRALAERTRPRDLYDVIHFYRRPESRNLATKIHEVLKAKCDFKSINMPTYKTLLKHKDECYSGWHTQLAHQLPALPPFEDFWEELSNFFKWLEDNMIDYSLPIIPNHTVISAKISKYYADQYVNSTIDLICFAASNHLCLAVEIEKSTYYLEPYALRLDDKQKYILYSILHQTQTIMPVPLDTINRLNVTSITFSPIYKIECLPVGPLINPNC